MRNYQDLQEFSPYRKVLILNDISLIAKFINFSNVAYVLHKSSDMQGLKREPYSKENDVDLLTFMCKQYIDGGNQAAAPDD